MTARLRGAGPFAVVALLVLGATLTLQGQTGALNGEWRTYGGDLASTRYAPLDQINATTSASWKSPGASRPTASARAWSSTCRSRR